MADPTLDALSERYGLTTTATPDLDALSQRYGLGIAPPAAAPGTYEQELAAQRRLPTLPPVDIGTDPNARGLAPNDPKDEQYVRNLPDAPLEESLNPVDLVLTGGMGGLSAKVGSRLAVKAGRYATPLARSLLTGFGAEVGYKASQATGMAPGSVTDVGLPDALNLVIPPVLDASLATGRQVLRWTRAGRALTAAEIETAARQAAYEQQVAAHATAIQDALGTAQRTHAETLAEAEAVQADKVAADAAKHQTAQATAQSQNSAAQADYAGKRLMLRNATVQANEAAQAAFESKQAAAQATAQAATEADQALYKAKGEDAYKAALAKAEEAHATARTAQAAYDEAVTSQGAAVARARELAANLKPETPAWVHYQELSEVAPHAPVDIDEVKALNSSLAGEVTSPQTAMPSRLQTIMADLDKQPSTIPLSKLHEDYMKELGPLTRSADPQTRRVSRQLLAGIHEALETSAGLSEETAAALPVLRKAKAMARREFAADDVHEMVLASVGTKNGQRVLRADALLKRFEDAVENRGGRHPLFRGSFPPEELAQMHEDLQALTQTPAIPTRPSPAPELMPGSMQVKDVGPPPAPTLSNDVGTAPIPHDPELVSRLKYGGPPEPFSPSPGKPTPVPRRLRTLRDTQPSDLTLTGVPDRPALPVPAEPTLPPPTLSNLARHYFGYMPSWVAPVAAPVDIADTMVSRLIMTRWGRAKLKEFMAKDGTVSLQALTTSLAGGRAVSGP